MNDNVNDRYTLPHDGDYTVSDRDYGIAIILNDVVHEIMMGEPAIDQIDAIQKALDMLEK